MVHWSEGRECCAVAPCAAMSFVPRRSAYRASDRVNEDTVRAAAAVAAAPPAACEAERAVTAALAARVQDHSIRTQPQPQLQQ